MAQILPSRYSCTYRHIYGTRTNNQHGKNLRGISCCSGHSACEGAFDCANRPAWTMQHELLHRYMRTGATVQIHRSNHNAVIHWHSRTCKAACFPDVLTTLQIQEACWVDPCSIPTWTCDVPYAHFTSTLWKVKLHCSSSLSIVADQQLLLYMCLWNGVPVCCNTAQV